MPNSKPRTTKQKFQYNREFAQPGQLKAMRGMLRHIRVEGCVTVLEADRILKIEAAIGGLLHWHKEGTEQLRGNLPPNKQPKR